MATDRLTLSQLLHKSPSSSVFHQLVLASRAYGMSTGGKNADTFGLTAVGREVVSEDPAKRLHGRRQAVMAIEPFRAFLNEYDKKKIPAAAALRAFLVNQAKVPSEWADQCMVHLLRDLRFAGLVRKVKDAEYVDLQGDPMTPAAEEAADEGVAEELTEPLAEADDGGTTNGSRQPATLTPTITETPRVFIAHGKNEEIAQQLKELLTFGKFEAVIAVEQQTVSKPVPEKVMEEMRKCSAAVIHVATEEHLLDDEGKERTTINENVLIEIGAAMALYGRNFILLAPKGLRLPSNLQGLYKCEYEGDRLDYEATMKLLKAFNDFR
jgi:CAP12/Pycsar effector protein, TIR domain